MFVAYSWGPGEDIRLVKCRGSIRLCFLSSSLGLEVVQEISYMGP